MLFTELFSAWYPNVVRGQAEVPHFPALAAGCTAQRGACQQGAVKRHEAELPCRGGVQPLKWMFREVKRALTSRARAMFAIGNATMDSREHATTNRWVNGR